MEEVGGDESGVWDQQIHTTNLYKVNNKDLLHSTGNYIRYIVIAYNRRECKKEYMYIYTYIYTHTHITESLCCTSETNITL